MTDPAPIEALLFDLGGVVIAIDFEQVFARWAPHSALPPEELRARFAVDTAYERHERGESTPADYFDHLRRLLALDASDAEIAAGWNAVFAGRIDATLDAIRQARTRLPCYCLTNTNPTHQAAWEAAYPEVTAVFDRIFVSSELGMRKPERAAYRRVVRDIGCPADRILFFDDLAANVSGARGAGLRAVQVTGPQDVTRALADIAPR